MLWLYYDYVYILIKLRQPGSAGYFAKIRDPAGRRPAMTCQWSTRASQLVVGALTNGHVDIPGDLNSEQESEEVADETNSNLSLTRRQAGENTNIVRGLNGTNEGNATEYSTGD